MCRSRTSLARQTRTGGANAGIRWSAFAGTTACLSFASSAPLSIPKATPRTIRGFDRNIILRGYGDGLYEDRFGDVWLKTTPEPLAPHLKRSGAPPKPRPVNVRD